VTQFEAIARHIALGEHYLSVKMPEKGIEQLRAALTLQPDNLRARLLLVRCLRALQRQDEACREVKAVLQADPDNVDGHYMASFLGANPQESLASIERALALHPRAAYLHSRRASILLQDSTRFWGLVKRRHVLQQGEAAARQALELNSHDWLAHRLLALALLSQNRTEEARQHVMNTLSLDPENPRSHILLSLLSNHQNDAKGAEAALREALRLDPTNQGLKRDLEIQQIAALPIFNPLADNPDDLIVRAYHATLGRLAPLWQLPALVGSLVVTMWALITIPAHFMKPGDLQHLVLIGLLALFCLLLSNLNYAARPWLARIPVKYLPSSLKKWGKEESPSNSS
jgi:tetratricopeptide (TPR) repeat protein